MRLEGEQQASAISAPSIGHMLEQVAPGKRIVLLEGADNRASPDPFGPTDVALSRYQLQDVRDYRQEIQGWFARVPVGGLLVLAVPHAFLSERRLSLPAPRRRSQLRLYTPASLMGEVEEALVPNSYRVRWLGDLDRGYDYALPPEIAPQGDCDVAVVLERIVPPAWTLARGQEAVPGAAAAPNYAFEPERTRIETGGPPPAVRRILLLKLDHLGDIIMGLPALERMRLYFPDAEIDLVVGSWNAPMVRGLGVADRVIAFDAFPRNSTEEDPNVEATLGQFRSAVPGHYDLALDMRTDTDTRTLLRAASARVKAAIGTRSRFPFLDIALPLDSTRNEAERAQEDTLRHDRFSLQPAARATHFGYHSVADTAGRDSAVVWGPYLPLEAGDYIFDFFIDLGENRAGGLLRLDVALEGGHRVAEMIVSRPDSFQLPFRVDVPGTVFEARITAVEDHPGIDFAFYGGRLIRKGRGNVLHQTEYGVLLVELVRLRILELDALRDTEDPWAIS